MSDFVASTPFAIGLLVAAGLLLLGIGVACLRNRLLLLMGLRNMLRRPAQTSLLLIGLTVSTVLIVASFGLGDSLTYSAQQQVMQETGQFDETVTGTFSRAQLDDDLSAIRQHPGVQAATGVATVSGRYRGNFLQLISERTRLSLQLNYLYGVGPISSKPTVHLRVNRDRCFMPRTCMPVMPMSASPLRSTTISGLAISWYSHLARKARP